MIKKVQIAEDLALQQVQLLASKGIMLPVEAVNRLKNDFKLAYTQGVHDALQEQLDSSKKPVNFLDDEDDQLARAW